MYKIRVELRVWTDQGNGWFESVMMKRAKPKKWGETMCFFYALPWTDRARASSLTTYPAPEKVPYPQTPSVPVTVDLYSRNGSQRSRRSQFKFKKKSEEEGEWRTGDRWR